MALVKLDNKEISVVGDQNFKQEIQPAKKILDEEKYTKVSDKGWHKADVDHSTFVSTAVLHCLNC